MKIIKIAKRITEVYLMLYLILFMGFRYQIAKPELTLPADIILVILGMIWAGVFLSRRKWPGIPRYPSVYILFILSFLTSIIHAHSPGLAIYEFYVWIYSVFIFMGILSLIWYGWDRGDLIQSALITGFVFTMLKAVQVFVNWGSWNCQIRLTNLTNKSAAFMALTIVLSLAVLINSKRKIWPGIVLGSSLLVIIATGSRAGILAAAGGIATVYITQVIKTKKINYYAAAAVAVFVIAFPIGSILITRPPTCEVPETGEIQVNTAYTSSIANRFNLWDLALDLFKENPVTGVGPGNYVLFAGPEFNWVPRSVHAHNMYLMIAAERGGLGLVTAAMVFVILLQTFLIDTKDPTLAALGLGSLAVVMIQGLADVTMSEPFVMRYFYLMLALAAAKDPGNAGRRDQLQDLGEE